MAGLNCRRHRLNDRSGWNPDLHYSEVVAHTDASVHDSQEFDDLLNKGNTSSEVYADSAYCYCPWTGGIMRNALLQGPLLGACLGLSLSGCSQSVTMFVTEGPLKSAGVPMLVAEAGNITSNTGPFSVSYPDGEKCIGKWSSLAPQVTAVSWGGLFTRYGAIAGVTTTVASVPGVNRGEAFAVCSGGGDIQAEFYTGSGTANGVGLAKDSKGNIFKMLF